MTPSLAGFLPPMTLLLLHLVRNGLVFTRVVYWMTPYFGEYTFYLIAPHFWLGSRHIPVTSDRECPPPRCRALMGLFPQISISFSYFSSNFKYFLPHFGPPGVQVAHSGRPWLRHCWKFLKYLANFSRRSQNQKRYRSKMVEDTQGKVLDQGTTCVDTATVYKFFIFVQSEDLRN